MDTPTPRESAAIIRVHDECHWHHQSISRLDEAEEEMAAMLAPSSSASLVINPCSRTLDMDSTERKCMQSHGEGRAKSTAKVASFSMLIIMENTMTSGFFRL